MFLMPLRHAKHKVRLMEIGLGCDMRYGPGASVALWKQLLPDAELIEAEFDAACVARAKARGHLDGLQVVTGDQGDARTLAAWKEAIGPERVDIIIDDGGHKNSQITASFDALWPLVREGGVYVIEDMMVGRHPRFEDTGGRDVMADRIASWIDQLLLPPSWSYWANASTAAAPSKKSRFPLPRDIQFVLCQPEACVIGKKPPNFRSRPQPPPPRAAAPGPGERPVNGHRQHDKHGPFRHSYA